MNLRFSDERFFDVKVGATGFVEKNTQELHMEDLECIQVKDEKQRVVYFYIKHLAFVKIIVFSF